jgi:archaellum component FlaC
MQKGEGEESKGKKTKKSKGTRKKQKGDMEGQSTPEMMLQVYSTLVSLGARVSGMEKKIQEMSDGITRLGNKLDSLEGVVETLKQRVENAREVRPLNSTLTLTLTFTTNLNDTWPFLLTPSTVED